MRGESSRQWGWRATTVDRWSEVRGGGVEKLVGVESSPQSC